MVFPFSERSIEKVPEIFTVTTEVNRVIKLQAQELGVRAWIMKPVKVEKIIALYSTAFETDLEAS